MDFQKSFSENIINEIFNIIEEKIKAQNNVSIKELASISGYSVGHFQRVFHLFSGMNVGTYIRRRRLSRAALLLKMTDMKVYEISINAGFGTQQSFSRAFLRQFRCPPKTFRTANAWSFVYYQPRMASNNYKDIFFNIIRGNWNELIGDNAFLLSPTISGDRLTVNYKRITGGKYDYGRMAKFIELSRCDMGVSESDFISLVYEELLPALSVVLTEKSILKIKDTCCGDGNIVERYFIPIF